MDDLVANFDLVLKAFGLTLGLFVVSGVASLLFGALLASTAATVARKSRRP